MRLALSAVRSKGSKIKGTKDWSPVFAHNCAVCRYWNQRLRHYFVSGTLDNPCLVIPAKYVPSEVKCEEDIHSNHGIALKEWHLAKGNTANLQVQHLENLIQYYSERRDTKRETAVKQILHWEEMRNLHGRQGQMMTNSRSNVIQTLLVPRPHSTDPKALMELTHPDHIQQVNLQRNDTKLAPAYGSHFTKPPLVNLVGQHGETAVADDIVNGTFDTDAVDEWTDISHRRELKAFLCHLQQPCNKEGAPIADMQWSFGLEIF